MKKLIIALGLVLGVVSFANAQGGRGGTPQERAERQLAQMESLKLSADQKAKITAVLLWQGKQIDSLRTASGGNFEGMREKFAPLMEETNKRVMVLLDDNQKKAYETILAERRARMGN